MSKPLLFVGIILATIQLCYSQATVEIEVNWTNWSSENRVTLLDPSNTVVLPRICNPVTCFNGLSNNSYTTVGTPQTYNLPYNSAYTLRLEDTYGDGWNGTASFVRVTIDGVVTLEERLENGSLRDIPLYIEAIPVNQPLSLFDKFNGYYDYAVTGDSFRTNSNTVNACSIKTTSTGITLTTPIAPSATIQKAYLFWAHSNSIPDKQVTFENQTINADITKKTTIDGINLYGMVSDVTSIIQGIADPSANTYDFSGLTIDNSATYCNSGIVLGGWSLMIFYTAPGLPAVSINLYDGFDGGQNTTTNYTLSGFFANGGTGSKTSVLSWEGDITLANNESLSITTGINGGPYTLNGDGDNIGGTSNPFNSTIFDNTVTPNVNRTTYGVDFDTYDISPYIITGENSTTTSVGVGQDFVILNAVLLKVPSNLITGYIFEDINYPGGNGRNRTTANGAPVENALVELYDSTGTFVESTTSDADGIYTFGGMENGNYSVRVVNSSVRSSRGGGASCTNCYPIQTFRKNYTSPTYTNIITEIGGASPAQEDVVAGSITNAQTVSTVTILNEGVVDLDFGFNFNTIVNTNESGQGSIAQFIVNSNHLDETGLDIEANSIFNPGVEEDTSIFMIPPTSDPLGRTSDANFINGYFDITISNGTPLPIITADNTFIDGRTQTAYSHTNTGTIGSGGTLVGTSANTLPSYNLPEVQLHRNNGDVIQVQGNNTSIRGIAVFASNNSGIVINNSSTILTENLIGVNADGIASGNIDHGISVIGNTLSGSSTISNNYIAYNTETGISISGGASTNIIGNHITNNGIASCNDNITILSGNGITLQRNLIENAAAIGIDARSSSSNIAITENTIRTSGQHGGSCSGSVENSGIRLSGNNSSITNNIINENGGSGIVITGGNTSGNLISRNSIYNNGTTSSALGIDIDESSGGNPTGNGVTLNDMNDIDAGPNGVVNFPVFQSAVIAGTTLIVSGWSRPGAIIEFFVTDISEGTASIGDNQMGLTQDYGEGQTFLVAATEGSPQDTATGISTYNDADGNTDNTNQFSFTLTIPTAYSTGTLITATATVGNSTSEFGNTFPVGARNIITNRRITYRIKKN
ncbi:sodium:calcium exchanger [Aquimarina sp. TRL1]|uniref:beta strand repeat-containing protein n=1 Tax=Aquimarina sp. (strain TRL1) TaxID=2736252 RepID=UPI00158A4617|nr:carboxypeptidase regulatory-like domain-containing protein [Aquimarina sp. TRL1]QKX05570.1 sodium:calcium exchanger [Aquimarina sp. TRL1]